MSLVLGIAVGLSLAVEEWIEGAVILVVIVANAVVGFLQEYSSEKTMQALRRLSSPLAKVQRDGKIVVVRIQTSTHPPTYPTCSSYPPIQPRSLFPFQPPSPFPSTHPPIHPTASRRRAGAR